MAAAVVTHEEIRLAFRALGTLTNSQAHDAAEIARMFMDARPLPEIMARAEELRKEEFSG